MPINTVLAVLCLPIILSSPAKAQWLTKQITGAWILELNENTLPDGTKRQLFGADPRGILILDSSGRYAQMQMRSDRPKFHSNNRLEGTADENSAIVQGTVAFFGTWTVDEG